MRRGLSIRARLLLVVALVTLAPVVVVWLSGVISVEPELVANCASGLDEASAALRDDGQLERIARDRALWLRVVRPNGEVRFERFFQRSSSLWHRSSAMFLGPGGTPSVREFDLRSRLARDGARCEIVGGGRLSLCAASKTVGGETIVVQDGWPRVIRALYDQRFALFKVTMFMLAPVLLLAGWLVRRIVPPIESLRDEVLEQMAKSDPAPVKIARDDELGDLAKAFNALLASIGARRRANRDFIAELAHELKNPAAAIRACAASLERAQSVDEARAKRVASVLDESARRIDGVVSGVLDLARVEAGLADEARERVDLLSLTHGVVESLRLDPRNASIELSCAGDPAVVRAVSDRVERALRNVLENAASFAGTSGWVRATVSVREGRALVQVDDSGPGISEADLPRVFERFFTRRTEGGTGLGLALTRAVIEAHGGSVEASSPAGQGARFVIAIPVSQ